MADQRRESAVAFLEAAVAYFAKLGIRIDRAMTRQSDPWTSASPLPHVHARGRHAGGEGWIYSMRCLLFTPSLAYFAFVPEGNLKGIRIV
jgi:hypothetical protein